MLEQTAAKDLVAISFPQAPVWHPIQWNFLHPHDRKWLTEMLALPREETLDEQVSDATARFYERGALDAV